MRKESVALFSVAFPLCDIITYKEETFVYIESISEDLIMKIKKKYIVLFALIISAIFSPLFASGQTEMKEENKSKETAAQYHKIDAQTAKEAFESQSDIIIIDVRTEAEYQTGHVVGAINIPLDVVGESVLAQFPNKEEKLYVYCRSGNRSAQAAKILVQEGYTNVYDFGGIMSWPYEIEK